MAGLVMEIIKYLTLFMLGFMIYMIWLNLIRPLLYMNKYKKYSNVYMDSKFRFMMGELWHYAENMKNDRPFYYHLTQRSEEMKDKDLKLIFEGSVPVIEVISPQAQKEFAGLQPHAVDRVGDLKGIGKIAPTSFPNNISDQNFNKRRSTFMRLLSLNAASKHIPLMLDSIKNHLENWKVDQKIFPKFAYEINSLTFDIFTKILFGNDIGPIMSTLRDFEANDGTFIKLNFMDLFIHVVKDYVDGYYNPISSILFFLNHYDLVNPFRRNKRNLHRFYQILNEAIDESKDQNSIFKQLITMPGFERNEIFMDLIFFMLAGTETTSHIIVGMLYNLKKYPHTYEKLIQALSESGFKKFDEVNEQLFDKEKILKIDYLNYVVKEALRIDNSAIETLYYVTTQPFRICNVPVESGIRMKIDIFGAHYNINEWIEPTKFIPERFDPNSEYYLKPNSTKRRNPYAHVPFSHGMRSCPGQTLALLEAKVIMAYLLMHTDYDIEEEQLQKSLGFAVGSEQDLNIILKKIS